MRSDVVANLAWQIHQGNFTITFGNPRWVVITTLVYEWRRLS